jgi:hypothetical protein
VGVAAGEDNDVHFSDPDFERITTLSRAATGLSPLEMHPGELADINTLMTFRPQNGSSSGPFPEPNDDGGNAFPSQSGTIAPPDIEGAPGPSYRGSQAKWGAASLKTLYNQMWRGSAFRKDTRLRAEGTAGIAAKQAGRIFQPQALPKDRRVLYVLEYDGGKTEYPNLKTGLSNPARS